MQQQHKIIPDSIKNEVETALSYYPDLKDIPIEFKFKKRIKKSVMLAQPTFSSLVRSRKKRGYVILISASFKINNQQFATIHVPKDVLIGWIGHELGHIMDYQNKGNLALIEFGIRYVLLKEHIKKAERAADSFAVTRGMGPYLIKTKRFILDNAEIPESYKERIRELYLSPEQIMDMIKKQEQILPNN